MKFHARFSAQLLSILLSVCFLSGCKSELVLETDDFYRFDKVNKLSIKKPVQIDYFLGIDKGEIPLNTTVYDKKGTVIAAPQEAISYYANDIKLPGETFLPDTEGTFMIVGKLAGQVSDSIMVRVWDTASLTLSLSITNLSNAFYATGRDTLKFKVDVQKAGRIIDIDFPYHVYLSNKEQTIETFSTTIPGVYRFQAKGLGLVSNELTVTALSTANYPVIRLPVIFHEVNMTFLTADKIRKLTDDMTRAFRNQLNTNRAQKDVNASDLFVEFYPAETGLDGNRLSSAGLDRIVNQKNTFTVDDTYSDAFNSFWDPANYLNVWVYPNITGDYASSSWAFFPSVTVPMEGFGVVPAGTTPFFPYGIFLNGNHVDLNFDGGRTEEILAHEAGHLLGLDHVFDGSNSEFNVCPSFDPDYCSDTPYYNRYAYNHNDFNYDQRYNRTSCDGIGYVSTNFMDYYYSHNNSFTADQMKRVRHTINYGLWLPTPYNGTRAGRKNAKLSIVERPANLKFIKPVICSIR
ncbi:M43 family zinc metalloprotease [Dyadobacter sp. NIV53]|uniref:M43 family zinc metalloprotease n=1 Tax=Dyadobacter sp. NIV53 TaxID=2861765 RepID=UPI001C876405|nr:M43 family zinc metalloprotease [Dyadobacter sp. NIV53]